MVEGLVVVGGGVVGLLDASVNLGWAGLAVAAGAGAAGLLGVAGVEVRLVAVGRTTGPRTDEGAFRVSTGFDACAVALGVSVVGAGVDCRKPKRPREGALGSTGAEAAGAGFEGAEGGTNFLTSTLGAGLGTETAGRGGAVDALVATAGLIASESESEDEEDEDRKPNNPPDFLVSVGLTGATLGSTTAGLVATAGLTGSGAGVDFKNPNNPPPVEACFGSTGAALVEIITVGLVRSLSSLLPATGLDSTAGADLVDSAGVDDCKKPNRPPAFFASTGAAALGGGGTNAGLTGSGSGVGVDLRKPNKPPEAAFFSSTGAALVATAGRMKSSLVAPTTGLGSVWTARGGFSDSSSDDLRKPNNPPEARFCSPPVVLGAVGALGFDNSCLSGESSSTTRLRAEEVMAGSLLRKLSKPKNSSLLLGGAWAGALVLVVVVVGRGG